MKGAVPSLKPSKTADPRRIATHIIKDHGVTGFHNLISCFQRNVDGETIGKIFGVTRQRVCQWRGILGRKVVSFEPDAKIQDLLRTNEPRLTKRTVV